ncbi:MAG: COG1470 family protein, partial [Armatimonadota bacterium]
PATGKPLSGSLHLQAVNERSLGWSEEMRKTIEAQIAAAPKIDELTCTLRLALTATACRAWFNGRYIGELPVQADAVPAGAIRLNVNTNAELLSYVEQPLAAVNNRFEPIDLSSFLNASALANGQRVAKLPAAGQAGLNGVVFRFPASANGNDHLDLGPSWSRFGAIAGYIDAQSGTFGGRWTSADRIDPSRFCMYVPYGQYKALHLIAAFDGEKDNVPVVTAQFYRPSAGHPMNFAGKAPAYNAKSGGVKAFPVTLANGKTANLYHVIVPIDPNQMAWFSDLPRVGLELTKAVQPYRGYPDPLEYSWHAGGLPSGVHIYAATLEKAKVAVDPQPDAPAHVWTAPAQPSYTITLTNNTGAAVAAKLTVNTVSYDGKDTPAPQQQTVTVPANGTASAKVALKPARYGLQTLKVTCAVDGETTTQQRDFAYLHPETRERGDWVKGKGAIFGAWNWGGGHDTPDFTTELAVMGQAGSETFCLTTFQNMKPEQIELARKYKFTSHVAFPHGVIYTNVALDPKKYDVSKPEAMKEVIDIFAKLKVNPSEFNSPEYIPFFPEPGLGPITYGIWPSWYNEKDYKFTEKEQEYFQGRLEVFLTGAKAIRQQWPDVKILLPYGDPHYTALFLRNSEEARKYIDGTALDMPNFERLPEQQINQVVLNRLYPTLQDIKKYIKDPYLVLVEGTCTSSKDYDTTPEDQANVCTRNLLVLMGYGVSNLESGSNAPFDCANYWGENHYGGGYCSRLPLAMPKLAYVSYATLTRHVNRKNFIKYVPTGSTSVYCQQYKHYQTGDPTYVLWTIRGTRPVTVKVQPGQTVTVYDVNDNPITLTERNGTVTFAVAQAPVYLEGLKGEAAITLGESDHSDAMPAKTAKKLTNLGSGWTLQAKHDEEYENTNKLQIERFLGSFTAQTVAAPKAQGGKALAVHLGQQQVDRKLMPYYTTFAPKAPVTIPGKASHLGLWVKASSDWGRMVYSLRDAKGEKWISVGTKDDWNGDDMRCWSAFAFDGWRYLRFEVPASAPFDSFRELGTSNWGSYAGDGIVDLPLKLEKIIIERRASVIYGNELVPAKTDDVLLGDLYAEYASSADATQEAVRLSKLRMPVPKGVPTIENPIAELAKTGAGAPTQVLKVQDPEHMYDGTRCHVFFTPVDGAKGYDIWVAPYEDGRGALKLGANVKPGDLIQGLRPEMDFYVFVTYTDQDGKVSKPSTPLKIRLKSLFLYK